MVQARETAGKTEESEKRCMNIPRDPIMLLSYLNTQLRDNYPSLEELCQVLGLNQAEIEESLKKVDYHYDEAKNQFV